MKQWMTILKRIRPGINNGEWDCFDFVEARTVLSVMVPERVSTGDSIDLAMNGSAAENARCAMHAQVRGCNAFSWNVVSACFEVPS